MIERQIDSPMPVPKQKKGDRRRPNAAQEHEQAARYEDGPVNQPFDRREPRRTTAGKDPVHRGRGQVEDRGGEPMWGILTMGILNLAIFKCQDNAQKVERVFRPPVGKGFEPYSAPAMRSEHGGTGRAGANSLWQRADFWL
jgi:hypothetical protein